jgi:hypothetical protein
LTKSGCEKSAAAGCSWTVAKAATDTTAAITAGQIDFTASSPKCLPGIYAYCCDEETASRCGGILTKGGFSDCSSISVPEFDKCTFAQSGTEITCTFKSKIRLNPTKVVYDEGHINCFSIFDSFDWEARCYFDKNQKSIRIKLDQVDCTNYGVEKKLKIAPEVYSANSDNASTYNGEITIDGISPPTVRANLGTSVLPELFLRAPAKISACSDSIAY